MSAGSKNRATGSRSKRQPVSRSAVFTRQHKRDLSCNQAVSFIDDYLAASLDAQLSKAFDAHLSACPDCVAFLATYRKTIEITSDFLRLQSAQQKPRSLTLRPNKKALARR
jgi:hypothetical protein